MVLGSSQLLPALQDFSVSLLLKDIFPTQTAKELGVTLDPYLFFDEHIINMFLLVCLTVGKKKKCVKHAFDNKIFLTILNTLVFSKLYRCSNAWVNRSRNNIQELQAVQEFACHILSGTCKYNHITPFVKELSLIPVGSEPFYRSAIMALKCTSGCAL